MSPGCKESGSSGFKARIALLLTVACGAILTGALFVSLPSVHPSQDLERLPEVGDYVEVVFRDSVEVSDPKPLRPRNWAWLKGESPRYELRIEHLVLPWAPSTVERVSGTKVLVREPDGGAIQFDAREAVLFYEPKADMELWLLGLPYRSRIECVVAAPGSS